MSTPLVPGVSPARRITVRGAESVKTKPDYVILTFTVEHKDKSYAGAAENVAGRVHNLTVALTQAGFASEWIKTTRYEIRENYVFFTDRKNMHQRQLDGYICTQRLQVEFYFDSDLLGRGISTVANCLASPQFDISYTIKDKDALIEELLKKAATRARRKAEVLCASAGGSLGKLVSVDYNCNNFPSHFPKPASTHAITASLPALDFQPKDIEVSETVTFVWEIE